MRHSKIVPSDEEVAAEMKAQGMSGGEIRDAMEARAAQQRRMQEMYDTKPPVRVYSALRNDE